jgi:hypothetical protein
MNRTALGLNKASASPLQPTRAPSNNILGSTAFVKPALPANNEYRRENNHFIRAISAQITVALSAIKKNDSSPMDADGGAGAGPELAAAGSGSVSSLIDALVKRSPDEYKAISLIIHSNR